METIAENTPTEKAPDTPIVELQIRTPSNNQNTTAPNPIQSNTATTRMRLGSLSPSLDSEVSPETISDFDLTSAYSQTTDTVNNDNIVEELQQNTQTTRRQRASSIKRASILLFPGNQRDKRKSSVLKPGQKLMTRAEVPSCPTPVYILFYILFVLIPVLLTYLTYIFVDEPELYLVEKIQAAVFIMFIFWIIGAIFKNGCGMRSNYTRKILHIFGFLGQFVFVIFFDEEMDVDYAFHNIVFDVLWAFWTSQIIVLLTIIPTRKCSDWMCGDTLSNRRCKWFNICTNALDAIERPEDRPNHLLWFNTQFVLTYLVLIPLSFWWNGVDSGAQVLIPAIVDGFGDGLAEPIGVRFGGNCCCLKWDNRYVTKAWFTPDRYTRSVAGSSMVWLSGYLAVFVAREEYTLWQFIIAMIIIPPIATFTEAKAPHALDNPFLALVVGVVATLILYIPLDNEYLG